MKEKITVLFTACGGFPTCGTISALKELNCGKYDYTIVGVDCAPQMAMLNYVDYLYKVPRCKDQDFVSNLVSICEKHGVDIIIPLISDEIGVISENFEEFEKRNIKVLLTKDKEALRISNDKYELQQFLMKNGIDVMPKSILIDERNVEDALVELGYPNKPVCLKKIDGCGSVGFRIVDDESSREAVFYRSRKFRTNPYISKDMLMANIDKAKGEFMLQEYLGGRELGTMCVVDHGRTIYSPSHDNLVMENSTAMLCELVNDEVANDIVRKVNSLLGFDGNIGYDFKRDDEGNLKMLEVNPRISATVSLAAKAGLNLVELGILHCLGYEIDETIVPKYGMKLMRNYGTLYELGGVPVGR